MYKTTKKTSEGTGLVNSGVSWWRWHWNWPETGRSRCKVHCQSGDTRPSRHPHPAEWKKWWRWSLGRRLVGVASLPGGCQPAWKPEPPHLDREDGSLNNDLVLKKDTMTLGWRGGVYHIWAAPQQPGWCRQCRPSWPPRNLSADASYPAAPSLLPSPRLPGQTPCGGSQQPETKTETPASVWGWNNHHFSARVKLCEIIHTVWANLPQSEAPQKAPSVSCPVQQLQNQGLFWWSHTDSQQGNLRFFCLRSKRAESSIGYREQTKLVDDSVMLKDIWAEKIPAVREKPKTKPLIHSVTLLSE